MFNVRQASAGDDIVPYAPGTLRVVAVCDKLVIEGYRANSGMKGVTWDDTAK